MLAGVWALALPPPAPAQTESDVKQQVDRAGMTEADVRRRIQESGMSPEQIRAALRERGYDPDALDPYMPGGSGARSGRGGLRPTAAAAVADSLLQDGVDLTQPWPPSLQPPPPRAPLKPEDFPEFTKEILRRDPDSLVVLPFGYEIFGYAPTTFEPLAGGPVDPDYPIGPGDQVIVSVWGDNELTHTAIVSREATISVPDIGQVVLNGLTLTQAKRLITDRLSTVYSGIRARRPSTFVDVTLGKLRTIQVFILGDVTRPGGYTISSVSTVLNALYSAGGPTSKGSMRDVRIIRHNDVYRHVDLYGYILTGSKAEDVRLQSGDVVFVPPIGKMVAVLGEVHRPAIYEMAPEERFHDLLRLSGGLSSTAVIDRVHIDRIIPFAERDSNPGRDRMAMDLPLRGLLADSVRGPELYDRDIVRFFRINDVRKNTVSLSGSVVYHPGTFEMKPDMRVSSLVEAAGGLRPDAYLERAYLVRTDADFRRSIRSFHLGKAIRGDPVDDLELQELDEVRVASVWEITDRHKVAINGSVRKPGSYEYLDGMTVTDLIFQAGGLKESAYKDEVEVSRIDSTTIATKKAAEIHRVSISEGYGLHSPDSTFALQPFDQVFVRDIPDWQLQRNVWITGEVQYPGTYSLKAKDERLSSLIGRAGGLKQSAYPRAATFMRRKANAGRLSVDVQDVALRHGRRYDLMLEEGDSLHIPKEPKTVKVVGEVGFASSVLYERGRSLGYYVDQAGGYTENSDKGRVKVIQPNGKVRTSRKFWFDPEPEAGALVIVPGKGAERKKETLKDVATIVGILSGAATTIFLAHEATK